MIASLRTINPRFPEAPAWMSDGRLFTDYSPNCLAGQGSPSYATKKHIQDTGSLQIKTDRSLTVLRAGSTGCVDTMVPEQTKRVCAWDGCVTLPAHKEGIGQGRLYVWQRPDLAEADPNITARETISFPLPGTFPMNPSLYMAIPEAVFTGVQQGTVGPAKQNRYSAPYGE